MSELFVKLFCNVIVPRLEKPARRRCACGIRTRKHNRQCAIHVRRFPLGRRRNCRSDRYQGEPFRGYVRKCCSQQALNSRTSSHPCTHLSARLSMWRSMPYGRDSALSKYALGRHPPRLRAGEVTAPPSCSVPKRCNLLLTSHEHFRPVRLPRPEVHQTMDPGDVTDISLSTHEIEDDNIPISSCTC